MVGEQRLPERTERATRAEAQTDANQQQQNQVLDRGLPVRTGEAATRTRR